MSVVVPTITTADPNAFNAAFLKFREFAKRIQIDVSDGTFAPTTLVPLSSMRHFEGIDVDLHVMTASPSQYVAQIIEIKPSLCIFHAEVSDNLPAAIEQIRSAGIKIGIALLSSTYPGKVQSLLEVADHAMIFAGKLGEQGGHSDLMQTEKIPLIKAIKQDLEIGWDGGANLTNVRALYHAGVDVINVGSAITNASDSAAMYQSLLAEMEKKGVLI